MRVFLFALALVLAVLGCSDGKLNLLIVFWGDQEESSSSRMPPEPKSSSSSSIIVAVPSSSSEYVPLSSSSEEELSSSSAEQISSSSESSSSRGVRYSSAKTDSLGYVYEDYPTLEVGATGVGQVGLASRYWDGCKPSCSWSDASQPPWATSQVFVKQCDKNGVKEMPLIYKWNEQYDPNTGRFIGVNWYSIPDFKVNDHRATDWPKSQTYKDWKTANPDFPDNGRSYTCYDQIPYTVNDTLAYAFAAGGIKEDCGRCFLLQFNGEWENGNLSARPEHRGLSGKKLVVMITNTGVERGSFDIMIPGGGIGDFKCFVDQTGLTEFELGEQMGGLLNQCYFGDPNIPHEEGGGLPFNGWTSTASEVQDCLRKKCNRVFGNKHPKLLEGCMWTVDWLGAAGNPRAHYKEVDCPKYLIDKYGSTVTTGLPKWPAGADFCVVDGTPCTK